jgi:hypothetical protein
MTLNTTVLMEIENLVVGLFGSPVWIRFELLQLSQDCDRTRGRALFSE